MINAVYDRIWPARPLEWTQEEPGILVSGRYKIVADRNVYWENDLLLDGDYVTNAVTVDRLKQVAANLERRNGHD